MRKPSHKGNPVSQKGSREIDLVSKKTQSAKGTQPKSRLPITKMTQSANGNQSVGPIISLRTQSAKETQPKGLGQRTKSKKTSL